MSGFEWSLLQFRQPLWLLLALQPVVWVFFIRFVYSHNRLQYAEKKLLPWVLVRSGKKKKTGSGLRVILFQLAWVLLAVAMAGPRLPDPPKKAGKVGGVDIMVLVDVSRSMTATDIKPSRLKRAKTEIFQLLSLGKLDRLGIIMFAGKAHVLSPLTWDHKALEYYAKGIKSGVLPTAGSNLPDAIMLANKNLAHSDNRAIVILTDGGSGTRAEIHTDLLDTPLYILGTGGYAPAPIPDPEGGWVQYDKRPVQTRLNSGYLQQLASDSGGRYVEMTDDMSDLEQLYYNGIINQAGEEEVTDSNRQTWIELYRWALLPALIIILLLSLQYPRLFYRGGTSHVWIAVMLVNVVLSPKVDAAGLPADVHARAYAAYQKSDFHTARNQYSAYSGYQARMGEAASAYQLKDYAHAITQFTQAFLVAGQDNERADALYNLANSFFRAGNYYSALSTYRDVLRYNKRHHQAGINLTFVKGVIKSIQDDPFAEAMARRRAGRGPRSMRASEDMQGGGDYGIDDKDKKTRQYIYTHSEKQENRALGKIASGQEHAQVADKHIQGRRVLQGETITAVELLAARKQIIQGKQDQSTLWKSLFEEEEGFPAPLEKPVPLPGVLPW
ncbi:MAG TPA: VWA domain-containing protein [Gammaproteobacteria bacterium]|nr:VWA domain-containing protein [Gammaproteobacteria bacterium]